MRLTIDHIRRAPQFTNTMLQREIDLRGMSLHALDEHVLMLLENNFDVINLTSNGLTSLEYFPLRSASTQKNVRMDRVVTLIAHRNQLQKVSIASCVLALPNVEHFLADYNSFKSVKDFVFLKYWKKLQILSVEMNPVWRDNSEGFDTQKLRAFLVFLCPQLKLINYERVTLAEREAAHASRKDFKELVQRWEGQLSGAARTDGKRLRKRGREMRAAGVTSHGNIAAGTSDAPIQPLPAGTGDGGASQTAVEEVDDLQTRLDQIEERILADDVTGEEIVALEQEMNDLTAEMERRKKRRKAI